MTYDVIVIGGGFAGLSAAVAANVRGARVLVLEARPSLGGRATAFRDPDTGELVDNGQHVLFGCFHETLGFLDRIDASDHLRLQPDLEIHIVDRDGTRSVLSCPPLPAPWHLIGGLVEWEALTWADRVAATRIGPPLRLARRAMEGLTSAIAASPGETVENWLIRNGQTERLRTLLWEPLALAALNQSPREAAAPPFVRVLAEMFGGDRRNAAIGIPAKPLDAMYAEPARRFLESRGAAVRTGAPARLAIESDRISEVRVREERLAAPVVIAAVPWFALPELFEGAPPSLAPILTAAAATAASPIVTVNLWFDRPVLDVPFIGLPGRVMQWVFDKRLAWGGETSHLSLISSGAGAVVGLPNEELAALAMREMLEAIPATRDAQLVRTIVVREKRATFSLAPGQPPRPATRTPIGNLLLAGDWIDTGLPATIEGAVRSGHRAAEAAAAG